jgi:putative DNA primase/helicase
LDANRILIEGGVEALQAWIASAQPAVLSQQGEIDRLARLEVLEYEQQRQSAAKRLGLRVGVLDQLVAKARGAAESPQDDWCDVNDTEIWLTPVDGIELLDDLEKLIGEFVVMTDEQRWATTLWTAFTHCFSAASSAPKLWVRSAEPRSGKTRLLSVLQRLVARPLSASYISAAMLPRVIEQHQPTLLLDEIDTFIGSSEELRGVLNTGFDPDGYVIIGVKVNDDWVPKKFTAWCPQALSGLGKLPNTIADRCIPIELERKSRSVPVSRLRRRDTGPLDIAAHKAARWAADNSSELEEAEPKMPASLHDRAADAWELLVAIADKAGGHWPERARKAARVLNGDGLRDDDSSIGIQLLADIRDVFEQLPERDPMKQQIASRDLVAYLIDLEDRPWPEFRRSMPLSQPQLARLLKPFHISPYKLRVGEITYRGYRRTQFEMAFSRYLPPLPEAPVSEDFSSTPSYSDNLAGTPPQPQEPCGFEANFEPEHENACSGSKNPENPRASAECSGVPGKNPEHEGGKVFEGQMDLFEGSPTTPPNGSFTNGEDLRNGSQPPPSLAQNVRDFAAQNPGLTPERIAKKFGITKKHAWRILGGEPE